jgi:putative flippase GtrA
MFMKHIVLIPAYCPSGKLTELVRDADEAGLQCLIINDGSGKDYDSVFNELAGHAVILHHEQNRGKGAALKTGMRWISEHEPDSIVICADADGQHLIEDIRRCAEAAEREPEHFILGVRSFEKKNMPARSWYGNKITETVFRLTSGVHIRDTQSGLRAFHAGMIPMLAEAYGERYEYEMNQLLVCARKGIQMIQIPIETVYEGNNEGSHFHVIRDSVRIYSEILKFSLSSLASFVLDTAMFAVLNMLFSFSTGMAAANILARICSASFNYEVNRSAVFRDSSKRSSSFLRYVMLAGVILILNTCLLYGLNAAGLSALPAKIMTEMILFIFSYIAQNRYVFNHSQRKAEI